jgi:hypothetical protein
MAGLQPSSVLLGRPLLQRNAEPDMPARRMNSDNFVAAVNDRRSHPTPGGFLIAGLINGGGNMTKAIRAAGCAAIVSVATTALIAQALPFEQSHSRDADRRIVVRGCLTAAPSSAGDVAIERGGPLGTAGVVALPAFLVTAATVLSGDVSTPAPAGRMYRVIGNPLLLSEHVGEKVEVTGTLEDEKVSAENSAGASAGSESRAPVVRMESGKTLAPACSLQASLRP